MVTPLFTPGAPKPAGPYSQAVAAAGLIFTAGQFGLDPLTGRLVNESIEAETAQALANLKAILAASGAGFGDVVSVTIHTTDLSLFQAINGVYAAALGDAKPARTTVQAAALPLGGRIEISMIARQDHGDAART